jgi:hypothetical protein
LSHRTIAPTMPHRLRSSSFATSSGLAPAGQAPGLPAPGPRAARCGKQDPSQGTLGRVPRSSRDASALAPLTRRAKVDEAASPARAPRDRSTGLQADPCDGEGEPPVGIPEDQRRAGKAWDPRVRDEYRDASSPLFASVRPPAGA